MLKHKYIDRICIAVICAAVVLTLCFMNGEALGITPYSSVPEYVSRLFDKDRVHTVDLQVDDWAGFIAGAEDEEYVPCTVSVDGEKFYNVGLRAKGNNSRRLITQYGLSRYSLKLEFDHYVEDTDYYGLDKFSLDASFQDNSYMKTYLVYDMMEYMGVPTPLCSYTWVTVNGEPWGLFLAIEEPEEAFAERCFGRDYGKLYKPDYKNLNDENADVDLRYTDDSPESYDNIFRKAKFDITDGDKERLIGAIKALSGDAPGEAVNVDRVLSYFAVQVFSLNLDSYIGPTGHNYFLYEEKGELSILPWDYNLAFGTYCLGMTDPIKDSDILINYPVNTPWEGKDMLKRPLFHNLMKNDGYFGLYHEYLDTLLREYIESGYCEMKIRRTQKLIAPYVSKDPTAFCDYEDHQLAADTLIDICLLRGESIRGQLTGKYPATLAMRDKYPQAKVDTSGIDIADLGDFDDLRSAEDKQAAAVRAVG